MFSNYTVEHRGLPLNIRYYVFLIALNMDENKGFEQLAFLWDDSNEKFYYDIMESYNFRNLSNDELVSIAEHLTEKYRLKYILKK